MRPPLDSLTAREREVLALLRRGLTNEEIASRLGITLDGAKYHVSQILSKLGVATREEASALAIGERRRWWARWPVWARIAGAATLAAAVAGLALLAWALLTTNDADEASTAPESLSVEDVYGRLESALSRSNQVFHTILDPADRAEDFNEEYWIDIVNRRVRWIPPEGDVWMVMDDRVYLPSGESGVQPVCLGAIGYLALAAVIALCGVERNPGGGPHVEVGNYAGNQSVVVAGNTEFQGDNETVRASLRFHVDAESYLPLGYEFVLTSDNEPGESQSSSVSYRNDFVSRDSLPADFFDPASLRDDLSSPTP